MSNLVRWNPVREMATMQNAMDRLFDDVWRNSRSTFAGNVLLLDVHETDDAYHVTSEMPGVNADQISINIRDGVLTIGAEIEQEAVDENTRVLLRERSYGKFSRSITLPQAVNADDVEATYDDGILTLTLPKVPEVQPKSIPVKKLVSGKKK